MEFLAWWGFGMLIMVIITSLDFKLDKSVGFEITVQDLFFAVILACVWPIVLVLFIGYVIGQCSDKVLFSFKPNKDSKDE